MVPDRRQLLLAASALLSAPLLRAQGARPKRLIAYLSPTSSADPAAYLVAFRAKLKELGHVEGRDFAVESRYAEGKPERLSPLARELIAQKPAVILTAGSSAVATLQKATASIPIVFASAADAVEQGFVKSLRRPGGNITGVTLRPELGGKILELIRECLPAARRIVVLMHESDQISKRIADGLLKDAASLRLELSIAWVKSEGDFERAFAEIAARKAQAVIVPALFLFAVHQKALAELAHKAGVPLFSQFRPIVLSGGLMSYFSDITENYRHAAVLVDKILRGAKPGDLPVEEPDRYLLIINLRTAKALGITIPQSVMLRADEVIQ